MKTTIDLALIRWSVVCRKWHDFSSGSAPNLGAFLAGWFLKDSGAQHMPEDLGLFVDSFRVGWREAEEQIEILSRE